jgi:hypothetical protein
MYRREVGVVRFLAVVVKGLRVKCVYQRKKKGLREVVGCTQGHTALPTFTLKMGRRQMSWSVPSPWFFHPSLRC